MRKNLICSLFAFLFTVMFFIVSAFAWFTIADKASTGGIGASVIDEESNLITSTIIGGSGSQSVNLQLELLPDEEEQYQMKLSNNSESTVSFKVIFQNINVTPISTIIDSGYYTAGPYVNTTTKEYVSTYINSQSESVPIDQTYFNHFIKDVTQAIKAGITSNSTPNYFGYLTDYDAENDEFTISINSGEEVTIYLNFYFDPNIYSIYEGVELQNSNPFMNQKISFTISVSS